MGKKKGKKGKQSPTSVSIADPSESIVEDSAADIEGVGGIEDIGDVSVSTESKKSKKGKKGKKDKKGKTGRKGKKGKDDVSFSESDPMLCQAAFYNLYYIAHDAAHALEIRGFEWPEGPKKKKKGKKGKKK